MVWRRQHDQIVWRRVEMEAQKRRVVEMMGGMEAQRVRRKNSQIEIESVSSHRRERLDLSG